MGDAGTWLCPTQLHRERLLEMERKLARPRAVMYGSLAVAFLIGIPWIGSWTLIPLAGAILTYAALKPRIATSERPEYVIAATVVIAQILIGIGIVLSGGPHSPVIAMLLLPIVTLPARFSAPGVWAGLGVTIVVLLLSPVAVGSGRPRRRSHVHAGRPRNGDRARRVRTALMRAEMEQRSEAVLDPLTGLLNRKALASRFDEIAQQAALDRRAGMPDRMRSRPLQAGQRRARPRSRRRRAQGRRVRVAQHLRSFELAYRLGGEEFLIVLPGVGLG